MPDHVDGSVDLHQNLEEGNLVFYGAADTGKTAAIEEVDDVQRICRLADLADPVAEFVALDDIYCLYQEYVSTSDQTLKEEFEAVVGREYGVCLVTRPRSLDWLLTHTGFADQLELSRYSFVPLRYEEDEAVTTAASLVSGLSADRLQDEIDRLAYSYEFESELLEEYTTYVPHIVLRSTALGDVGGVFPGDVLELSRDGALTSLRGFGSRLADSIGFRNITVPSTGEVADAGSDALAFLQDYDQVYEERIQSFLDEHSDEMQDAAVSLVGGVGASAAPIVGPLLVGALLRPDGTAQARATTADFFGELFDDELLPTTRCVLEEEMGVPPMTLEYLRTVTRPEFHTQLAQLAEADIEHIEAVAMQTQTAVDTLHDDLDQLADRVTAVEGFISDGVRDAVEPYDVLRPELEALERQYLQVSGRIPIEELELQNVDFADRYRELLTGPRVQVFRGPHGTGKTTLSYRLCQQLAEDGYTVRIPRLDIASRTFVRTALQGEQEPVAVVTSYRLGDYPVDDAADITFLLELVDEGTIDTLLIECRDEVFAQLDDGVKTRTASDRVESRRAELWRFKNVFSLPRVEDDGIQAIAEWVGEIKNEPETVQAHLPTIIEIAGNNPEVAKIATRIVCDGQDLSGIQTEDDLLWYDIQNLTAARDDTIEAAQRTIVKWLAVSRGLPRDELKAVSELPRDDFHDALDNLSQYLQTADDGTNQLIPDVYQEIIFREECLDQLDRYVQGLTDEGMEQYIPEVALNITVCANIPDRDAYPGLEGSCLDGSEIVLSPLVDGDETALLYYSALETLAATDLPISVSQIQAEPVVEGIVTQLQGEAEQAYRRGNKVHTVERPESLSRDIFSSLAANYIVADADDAVDGLVDTVIDTYRHHQQQEPSSWLLDYRGETAYEVELEYIVACFGGSFEQVAAHRDVPSLVDDLETVRDTILAHADEIVFPFPDPFEDTRYAQSTVLLYSQAVAGVAYTENDEAVIAALLSAVHTSLQQTFRDITQAGTPLQAFSEEEWLVRAHGLFIKALMYRHEFDLVDNWPSTVEDHVNQAFSAEAQCQFYKYIVEWGATRSDMAPRPGWLLWILSHDGILSIALDEEFDFMVFSNSYVLAREFMAACLGVVRRFDLPKESAQLLALLDERSSELNDHYSTLFQDIVEDLQAIDAVTHR